MFSSQAFSAFNYFIAKAKKLYVQKCYFLGYNVVGAYLPLLNVQQGLNSLQSVIFINTECLLSKNFF